MAIPTIYNQIDNNKRKTLFLMLGFSLFMLAVVYILVRALGYEGPSALGLAGIFLIVSGLINLASYFWSDKLVVALSGAREIQKKDHPELFRTVENLSIAAGLPMPKVYIVEDAAPNAFATGRDPKHGIVAVTTGLLERLDDLELEGVVAHEMSHIGNYDSRLMSVIVVLVGIVALASDIFLRSLWFGGGGNRDKRSGGGLVLLIGIVVAILAPIAAQLIKLAISRRREFLADSSGALLTRHPEGLASALLKISADRKPVKSAYTATAHLYIENPFKEANWFFNLFSTHPPVEERVKALRQTVQT